MRFFDSPLGNGVGYGGAPNDAGDVRIFGRLFKFIDEIMFGANPGDVGNFLVFVGLSC